MNKKVSNALIISLIFAFNPIIISIVLGIFGVPVDHSSRLHYPLTMFYTIPASVIGFIFSALIYNGTIVPRQTPLKKESFLNTLIFIYIVISLFGMFDALS